jgi:hypothetical protein
LVRKFSFRFRIPGDSPFFATREKLVTVMPLLDEDQEKSFSKIVRESTEEGLANVIGKSGSQAVIINFGLRDRAMDPLRFHEAMVKVFRESSAVLLEKAIIKEVCLKLRTSFDPTMPFSFEKEFNSAKTNFLKGEF